MWPWGGKAGPRPAFLVLGLLILGLPLTPAWGGVIRPWEDLRWPVLTAGALVVLGLLLAEALREGQGGVDRVDRVDRVDKGRSARSTLSTPSTLPTAFIIGALLIGGGLVVSALASPAPWLGLRTGLREIFLVGFAVCLSRRPAGAADLGWVVLCLVAALGIQAAMALWQGFGAPLLSGGETMGRRLMYGGFEQSEILSSFLGAGAAAAGLVLVGSRRGDSEVRAGRAVAWVALPLALAALFFAGGRGGTIGFVVALGMGLTALRRRGRSGQDGQGGRDRRARRVYIPLAVAGLLVLLGGIWLALPGGAARRGALPARLAETFDPYSLSVRHRIGLMTVTGRMILDAPLTGAGPGRFGAAFGDMQERLAESEAGVGFWTFNEIMSRLAPTEAHCDPLQWWAEYGSAPFFGLLLILMAALAGPWRALGEGPPWRLALWGALAALAVGMWVGYPLREPVRALLFWTLAGLLAGRGREAARTGRM